MRGRARREIGKRGADRGRTVAGQRLVEEDLSRELGVSRSPLREALRILEKEGHVQRFPGVGIFLSVPVPIRQVTEQMTIAFATI